jgi:hypothetical protein
MKLTQLFGALAVAAGLLTSAANAATIQGEINIAAIGTANIDFTANTVTFSPTYPATNAIVGSSTGDFAALAPVLTFGSYKNFTYDPLSVANPIWTFGGVSFNLLSVTSITEDSVGPERSLVLFGSGVATAAGYDDTVGSWSFSADTTSSKFSWSSTASTVPEGGATLALLGLGLVGLEGARRRLKAAKA